MSNAVFSKLWFYRNFYTVKGLNPGESMFVVGWLIVRVGVVLRRTVVGCDPGESVFVVG